VTVAAEAAGPAAGGLTLVAAGGLQVDLLTGTLLLTLTVLVVAVLVALKFLGRAVCLDLMACMRRRRTGLRVSETAVPMLMHNMAWSALRQSWSLGGCEGIHQCMDQWLHHELLLESLPDSV